MPPPPAASQFPTVPLCVDLDGTIIRTDLLWETLVQLLGRNPLNLFLVPFWWRRGRARLKAELAARTKVDVALLPYYQPLLEYLRAERKVRPIILATASDRALAEQVAGYLDLFTEVMASDGQTNLRGKTKLAALTARFGVRGFDYAGNSSVDLAVWAGARQAIVVGRDSLADQARRRAEVSRVFSPSSSSWQALFQTLQPLQWIKNLLIVLPALAARRLAELPVLVASPRAFLAFCLAGSAVCVFEALAHLEDDRRDQERRLRPFAAGDLALPAGLLLIPVLLASSVAAAWRLPASFGLMLTIYLVLEAAYSLRLKQAKVAGLICQAALYLIRLVAGYCSVI
jgi:hypothetical protein